MVRHTLKISQHLNNKIKSSTDFTACKFKVQVSSQEYQIPIFLIFWFRWMDNSIRNKLEFLWYTACNFFFNKIQLPALLLLKSFLAKL